MHTSGFRRLLSVCFLILGGAAAWVSAAQAAQSGNAELTLGLGPRPAALGGAFTAGADDQDATLWNPAGLSQLRGSGAEVLHGFYLLDTAVEHAAVAQKLGDRSGIGVQAAYLNCGSLEGMDENGESTGTFTPYSLLASVGYGQQLLPGLGIGAAVKLIRQDIQGQTYTGGALDLGAIIPSGVRGLQLGAVARNIGPKLVDISLPAEARAGGAYALPWLLQAADEWRLFLDAAAPLSEAARASVHCGTEYWYQRTLAVRAGYALQADDGLGAADGLSAGIGFRFSVFQVDYALVSFGDLGLTHQIALVVNWD